MIKQLDAVLGLLVLAAFLSAAAPWTLQDDPGEGLVWGFAVAPPLAFLLLLGLRDRFRGAPG